MTMIDDPLSVEYPFYMRICTGDSTPTISLVKLIESSPDKQQKCGRSPDCSLNSLSKIAKVWFELLTCNDRKLRSLFLSFSSFPLPQFNLTQKVTK